MLLTACAPSFVAAPRLPDPGLLEPCVDPELVPDSATASDNAVAAERISVAEAYAACKRKQADDVTFIKGGK